VIRKAKMPKMAKSPGNKPYKVGMAKSPGSKPRRRMAKCPGSKIRSGGVGRGLGRGKGKGPIGRPYRSK